jgi:tetratricopeptide (TPR) repeat protein
MRLPRMTMRRWAFAILVLSGFLCAERTSARSRALSDRAFYHHDLAFNGMSNCNTCLIGMPRDPDFLGIYYDQTSPRRAWHARLAKKYIIAASRPWLPVGPDPPPPDAAGQGFYWYELGDHRRAVAAYEDAIRFDSADFSALNGLAWLLATSPEGSLRDGKRAVDLAIRACRLTFRPEAACIDTLAAAYAEAGDFAAAIETQQEVIGMISGGDPDFERYRTRLELYNAGKPFRDEPNGRARSGGGNYAR